jgi:integrase/recombinase XerC
MPDYKALLMINFYLKYLQTEKRYSKHTILSYATDIEQFTSFLQDIDSSLSIEQATSKTIRSWIVSLIEKNISPRTVNRKIASLRSFYKYLLKREYIIDNPATKLRPVKTSKLLPQFVQESDMDLLLDHVEFPNDLEGIRDRLIIQLLYGTGIRLAELIGLKYSDIDLYNGTIKVKGKRNKERIIPLNLENQRLIKAFKKERDFQLETQNEYLIVTASGEPSYPMMIQRVIKKYLSITSKVKKKSPHVLRHSFATHMLNNGADLNAVKDLLGHANLAATQVYTHNSMDKLKKVFDQAHPKA